MRVVCIVQARMGSTRLPGKVLLPLNGHTVIEEVLSRCKQIPGVDEFICATPERDYGELFDIAARHAIVYCGSNENVLARYYNAAYYYDADIVLRITGDCPLISPELCGAVLRKLVREKAAYASNIEPRTFPKGLDCEAFTFRLLQRANREATSRDDREHVTTWMRRCTTIKRVNVASPWPMQGRLCLDTEDDYRVICAAFGHEPYQRVQSAGSLLIAV